MISKYSKEFAPPLNLYWTCIFNSIGQYK